MQLEINDIVYYAFISEFRGKVKVRATIIDIYPALYNFTVFTEVSLRYEDLGDTITEHGIDMNSPKITLN